MRHLLLPVLILQSLHLTGQDPNVRIEANPRNAININFDLLANSSVNGAPYFIELNNGVQIASYNNTSHAPIYQRALSLSYNRQLLRSVPFLFGQINSALVSFDVNKEAKLNPYGSILLPPVRDRIAISMLYVDPGLELRWGQKYPVQVFAGGGLTYALVLRSFRRMEQADMNSSIPNSPISQEFKDFIAPERGYYFHFGTGARLTERWSILLRLRWYRLRERTTVNPLESFNTNQFLANSLAAPERRKQLQLQLGYSW